jgi:hypothetical protein
MQAGAKRWRAPVLRQNWRKSLILHKFRAALATFKAAKLNQR